MSQLESKTQVDRLGERLKQGDTSEEDLRLLDQYRRSFGDAYEFVISIVRDRLGLQPTGRAAKSTTAIIEKLRRESIRLTQIQDIAGCRLIVSNLAEQDRVVSDLRSAFTDVRVVDRRQKPSHGYRAVHVIVQSQDRVAEIQVRTLLQHGWAEVSEKVSDNVGKDIKYGGGSESLRSRLLMMSELIARNEEAEAALAAYAEKSDPDASERRVGASDLERALRSVAEARESMRRDLAMLISRFADPGVNDAVSD